MRTIWLQASPLLVALFLIALVVMPPVIKRRRERRRERRPYLGETIPNPDKSNEG